MFAGLPRPKTGSFAVKSAQAVVNSMAERCETPAWVEWRDANAHSLEVVEPQSDADPRTGSAAGDFSSFLPRQNHVSKVVSVEAI